MRRKKCYRGVVVKRADSYRRGCKFQSCTCHNKNTIGEEGNGKPPHKVHFPGINSEPCFWFIVRVCDAIEENPNARD